MLAASIRVDLIHTISPLHYLSLDNDLHSDDRWNPGKKAVMATWADLVKFVRREFEVARDEPDEIRIRLHYGQDIDDDGRTQVVVLAKETLDNSEEWVQIATPFAQVDEVDLKAVLEEIGATTVVGGAVIMGEHLVLRHSLPLINLDINEFIDPLDLITDSAERLEQRFIGRDDY